MDYASDWNINESEIKKRKKVCCSVFEMRMITPATTCLCRKQVIRNKA